VFRPLADWYL